jgi:hypothetical protein
MGRLNGEFLGTVNAIIASTPSVSDIVSGNNADRLNQDTQNYPDDDDSTAGGNNAASS